MQCARQNRITHRFEILKHKLHKHALLSMYHTVSKICIPSLFQAPWALGLGSTHTFNKKTKRTQ